MAQPSWDALQWQNLPPRIQHALRRKNIKEYVSAAIAEGWYPSKMFFVWFTFTPEDDNWKLNMIGGRNKAIGLWMKNGGAELFAALDTPEALAWLAKPGYLHDFFSYLLKFAGR